MSGTIARAGKGMTMMKKNISAVAFALLLVVTMLGQKAVIAQWDDQPNGSQVTPDPWPKIVKQAGATYALYQPQLDNWDGYNFNAHAAVSVLPAGAKDPQFGVIEITAKTHVFRLFRRTNCLRFIYSSWSK